MTKTIKIGDNDLMMMIIVIATYYTLLTLCYKSLRVNYTLPP